MASINEMKRLQRRALGAGVAYAQPRVPVKYVPSEALSGGYSGYGLQPEEGASDGKALPLSPEEMRQFDQQQEYQHPTPLQGGGGGSSLLGDIARTGISAGAGLAGGLAGGLASGLATSAPLGTATALGGLYAGMGLPLSIGAGVATHTGSIPLGLGAGALASGLGLPASVAIGGAGLLGKHLLSRPANQNYDPQFSEPVGMPAVGTGEPMTPEEMEMAGIFTTPEGESLQGGEPMTAEEMEMAGIEGNPLPPRGEAPVFRPSISNIKLKIKQGEVPLEVSQPEPPSSADIGAPELSGVTFSTKSEEPPLLGNYEGKEGKEAEEEEEDVSSVEKSASELESSASELEKKFNKAIEKSVNYRKTAYSTISESDKEGVAQSVIGFMKQLSEIRLTSVSAIDRYFKNAKSIITYMTPEDIPEAKRPIIYAYIKKALENLRGLYKDLGGEKTKQIPAKLNK